MTAKSKVINDREGRSGGRATKAVELTSGDLQRVRKTRTEQVARPATALEKSAEGIVGGAIR